MNQDQFNASTDGTTPIAVLYFWKDEGFGFDDYDLDTMGITIDPVLPGVVWLEVCRRDGPSVRIQVTQRLSVLIKSALSAARDLAALDTSIGTDHHE